MKKASLLTFVLFSLSVGSTKTFAQTITDSATIKALSFWVNKFKLSEQVTKKITPLVNAKTKRLQSIDSLPASGAKDSLKIRVNQSFNDRITSVLIRNGYADIESSRFTNALKYKKELNLTNEQIDSLVSKNLVLDEIRHSYVPKDYTDRFDARPFTNANFRPIFTNQQYDIILAIETKPNAVSDARRIWQNLSNYGLKNNIDSVTNFNSLVDYCLNRLLLIKKHADDVDKSVLLNLLKNLNKPDILQKLDSLNSQSLAVRDSSLIISAKKERVAKQLESQTEQALAYWVNRYNLTPDLTQKITPLVTEKTKALFRIDSIAKISSTVPNDAQKRLVSYGFDDQINAILVINDIPASSTRFSNILKFRQVLQLTNEQVNQLVAKNTELEQLKRSFVPKEPLETFDARPFTKLYFKPVFNEQQYDKILHIETRQQAYDDSQRDWDALKQFNLLSNIDSVATFNTIVTYNLNRGVAVKKCNEDITNKVLVQQLKDINQNKPPLLKQLDIVRRQSNLKPTTNGNYVW